MTNMPEEYVASKYKAPRSKQRENLMHAHRARGHQNNNLWLVYRVKTRRDWILPSDRQLIHWLHYLETNKDVRTFDLAPEPVTANDGQRERRTELDAVVTLADGTVEWHEVKAHTAHSTSQLTAQRSAATREGHIHRLFTDDELVPHVKTAMRWLKAINFAASIRDLECATAHLAVLGYAHRVRRGIVRDFLVDLEFHESPIVQGVLVRLAVEGVIDLELGATPFGPRTPWTVITKAP